MWRRLFISLVSGALTVAACSARAFLVDEDAQRVEFRAALTALEANDLAKFNKLRESLDGYVLSGYLDYQFLTDRLERTPTARIHAFLEANSHIPGSDVIRKRWLRSLAARGDWATFLTEYKNIESDPDLQCRRLGHLLRASEDQTALMQEIDTLWRTGERLPVTCNPVFATWKKAGHMTPERVWERMRMAMEARQTSLALELAQQLEARERIWITRWVAMHRDPVSGLDRINYPVDTPVARMIVRHGVVRLAYRDVDEAVKRWDTLKEKYQFFGEDDNYVARYLGILAAQQRSEKAVDLLARVSVDINDESLQLWRVRAALLAGDWERARHFIAALPEGLRQRPEGRYWMARAMEKTGQPDEARVLYQALSTERGYYAFMAADRVDVEYSMRHKSVVTSVDELKHIVARPGVQAARELYAMGMILEARRQWQWNMRHMNNRELAVAAVVVREWGWHDRAILTMNRSDYQDDLDIRFPVLYRESIHANAQRHGIDPSWVYGVVRQESAFVPDARSSAGALGLMQLMPETGRSTGRQLNLPLRGIQSILEVENNLKLGVGYLKNVLARYQNHHALATAAYNAGPNRVREWIPPAALDADVWVETIPFNETRDYVKNVMSFTAVYDHRLGIKPIRLKERMREVPSAAPAP